PAFDHPPESAPSAESPARAGADTDAVAAAPADAGSAGMDQTWEYPVSISSAWGNWRESLPAPMSCGQHPRTGALFSDVPPPPESRLPPLHPWCHPVPADECPAC